MEWRKERIENYIIPAYVDAGVDVNKIHNFDNVIGDKGWIDKQLLSDMDISLFDETIISVIGKIKVRPISLRGYAWDADFGDYIAMLKTD